MLSEEERLAVVSSVKALDSLSGGTTGEKLSRLVPNNTDWLIGNLLGYGSDLKIISPKRIRDEVIKLAEEVLKLY